MTALGRPVERRELMVVPREKKNREILIGIIKNFERLSDRTQINLTLTVTISSQYTSKIKANAKGSFMIHKLFFRLCQIIDFKFSFLRI